MPAFSAVAASYRALWTSMKIKDGKLTAADAAARRILGGRARYQAVERSTGVPWVFVGLAHLREGNLNFGTYLGNGQSIARVTTIVPVGRGPFASFEAGALDALTKMAFTGKPASFWTLERIAYSLEGFNGYGYRGKGVNSPYLWGGTNHYTRGKYVRDGVYDPNHVDQQLGSMAVLARLCALDAEVNALINGGKPGAVRDPVKDTVVVATTATVATGAVGAKQKWSAADFVEAALWLIAGILFAYIVLRLFRSFTERAPAVLDVDHPALAAPDIVPDIQPARRGRAKARAS